MSSDVVPHVQFLLEDALLPKLTPPCAEENATGDGTGVDRLAGRVRPTQVHVAHHDGDGETDREENARVVRREEVRHAPHAVPRIVVVVTIEIAAARFDAHVEENHLERESVAMLVCVECASYLACLR